MRRGERFTGSPEKTGSHSVVDALNGKEDYSRAISPASQAADVKTRQEEIRPPS